MTPHEAGCQIDVAEASALRLTAHRSLARGMRRALALVLLLAAAVGAGIAAASGPLWQPLAFLTAVLLIVGGLGGLYAIHQLAAAITNMTVRPLELLLSQPGMADEMLPDTLNWRSKGALSRAELDADFAVLDRHMRRRARQSRDSAVELERAREQANQQSIAKSQFLAKMSHELRTPLNAILGYATILQEDAAESGNASAAADLSRIQRAGRNLLTIVNDILDLTKIEAGKTPLAREAVDVGALVDEAVASWPESERNGNRFAASCEDGIGIMIGDAAKLRQCLIHLLGNAFKFTERGEVSLSVTPTMYNAAPAVEFVVRDSGVGIDADRLDSLFEAFGQVDAPSSRRLGGTGIGLAITRQLARLMGGDCTMQSVKGGGSEFRLVVPIRPPGQSTKGGFAAEAAPARPVAARLGASTALVVDDDEAAVDLLRRWLERIGYDVVTAADGETGLAVAREHRPDIMLLDALLPGRSGYDILKELRADLDIGLTPVILVTVDDDRARGLAAGASEYLRKPITAEQLREVTEVYRVGASGDILVIEDNDDDAELIRRSVEQIGFSTRRARDGLDGIAMALTSRPAAIVLDLVMPGLDGFGVIERLAADRSLVDVPLLILSGADLSLRQHRALATAGHRIFTKGSATPRQIAHTLQRMAA